jgi:hypothetical protein
MSCPCVSFIKHRVINTHGNWRLTPQLLTSALDGLELSFSHPGLVTHGERAPLTKDRWLDEP